MTTFRLGVVGGAVALVAALGWLILPTRQEAGIDVGKTELHESAKAPMHAPDAPPTPTEETLVLELGQTLKLMGVEPGPSSARFCDEANWTALGPVAERVEEDAIFVDAVRWAERTAKERSSLASWMSKCLQAGREVAIHSSDNGDLIARYDSEHGYRAGLR